MTLVLIPPSIGIGSGRPASDRRCWHALWH